jgi:glycosyltransferase involved in cell wall biosynthesis
MNPPQSKLLSYFLKVLFRDADCIVVLSEKEKKILGDRYNRSDISIMRNAVNLSLLEKKHVEPLKAPLKLIFMGRISESKGIYVIGESFRFLEDHFDKFSLEIYGAGPELQAWLQQLSDYKGLNFAYKGVARGKLKWEALENADVFLLPSLHSEGMPIALIEAMAAGCTSIVTDDASITTIVTGNENGIVVNKNDPGQVAQKIREIIEGTIDSCAIGKCASDYIRQNLSISTYAHQLDQLYHQLN